MTEQKDFEQGAVMVKVSRNGGKTWVEWEPPQVKYERLIRRLEKARAVKQAAKPTRKAVQGG